MPFLISCLLCIKHALYLKGEKKNSKENPPCLCSHAFLPKYFVISSPLSGVWRPIFTFDALSQMGLLASGSQSFFLSCRHLLPDPFFPWAPCTHSTWAGLEKGLPLPPASPQHQPSAPAPPELTFRYRRGTRFAVLQASENPAGWVTGFPGGWGEWEPWPSPPLPSFSIFTLLRPATLGHPLFLSFPFKVFLYVRFSLIPESTKSKNHMHCQQN